MNKLVRQFIVFLLLLVPVLSSRCWVPRDYHHMAVVYVYDGDTVKLANGERVRLIGMDCPEMHDNDKLFADSRRTKKDIETIKAMGRRAYAFTKELVDGKKVRVEFDAEQRDKYGRLLAYIYLNPDDLPAKIDKKLLDYQRLPENKAGQGIYVFVNGSVVKAGFAQPMTIPPNTAFANLFKRLYNEAHKARRGLWRDNP